MSARKKSAEPAAAPTATPGRILGPDGKEWVSINISKHRTFARAALIAWKKNGGPNQLYMLEFAKAVSVPADVLEDARKSLSPEEVPQEHAE